MITKLERQAVTIHFRINELIRRDHLYHNLRESEVKLVVKMCKKFLSNCECTKYKTDKDEYGDSMLHVLKTNLVRGKRAISGEMESPAVYLTWISFGLHHVIRKYCPEHNPDLNCNYKKINRYYKKTLELLTR